ncbi:hypothetical protein H5T51_02085 [Candidatus Bathyarchaeota archaeon]|nr:hypothetical protein [Candidatus Bathyarchaeota archaeon]
MSETCSVKHVQETSTPVLSTGYATVCVTFKPEDVPGGFLRKVLSVAASKVGCGDVNLASHVMIIVNVGFKKRAGRVAPEVLLLKNPVVLGNQSKCWGGGESAEG